MNFLQLCQRVFSEGGITGQITSTQNQTGEALRIVNWVADAYQSIVNDQGLTWKFMRASAKVQLTAGQGEYTFADLSLSGDQWDTRSMRVAANSDLSDETFVDHKDYLDFRDFWQFSSRRSVLSRPLNVAVDDDLKLCFGPVPDRDYWVVLKYQRELTPLIEVADTPIFPARFHMAIVWHALRSYGLFEAAPELVARADMGLKSLMLSLEMDQAEEVTVGGALC